MTSADREALRQDLLRDEGLRLAAYPDHLGFLTIGVGRLIDPRKPGAGLTHDEALYLLDNDMRACLSDLSGFPWFDRLWPVQQRALLNMRFQLGPTGFRGFRRMLAALDRGDIAAAVREALDSRWATQTPDRAQRVVAQLARAEG